MKKLIQKSRLSQLAEQRNGYLVLASGLSVLCLLLILLCFFLSGRERVVVVPPAIDKAFWVSPSEVSPDYLTQWSTFIADLLLNVTPDSADYQRQLLLRYTDPKFYGVFNDQLIAERDRIRDQHVSTVFYPVAMKVDAKAFSVEMTGDLKSSVGTTELPTQRLTYAIQYHYSNGRLLISHFNEVKAHD